jgi:hypothetical protein
MWATFGRFSGGAIPPVLLILKTRNPSFLGEAIYQHVNQSMIKI